MSQKAFFIAPLLAIGILSVPNLRLSAMAQSNDNSNKPRANSSQSNANQNQQAPNDNSKSSASEPQQPDQNQSSSKHDNNSATNTGPDRGSDTSSNQSDRRATDRDNSSDSSNTRVPGRADSNRDSQRSEDRSLLTDRDRDSEADRRSADRDRDRDNRTSTRSDIRDNRETSREDRNRDFRRDFKFGKSSSRGLTVSHVTRGSIFHKSGLRDDDVIVSFNGHRIRNEDDFDRFVVFERGQRLPVVVFRDGREQTIYVNYQDQDEVAQGNSRAYFGAEFDPQQNDVALITRVEEGSPADRAGLKRDDLVIAINGDRVSSGRDAMQIIESQNSGARIEVEYSRQARTEVVLSGSRRDNSVQATNYQSEDRRASVAAGVNTDETRRTNVDRDRNDRNLQNPNRDRRDERRGILPRLRN